MQENLQSENALNVDEDADERDILFGNNNLSNDNNLQSFKNQIEDITKDTMLEKKSLIKEEYKLQLEGKLNSLDEQCAQKIEQSEQYQDAKKAHKKAIVAIAGAALFIVSAPYLAPYLATVIGVLIAVAAKKHAEAKKVSENIKDDFNKKKRLVQVQGKLKEMNDPELKALDEEIRRTYEPVKINKKIKELEKNKKKLQEKSSIFDKLLGKATKKEQQKKQNDKNIVKEQKQEKQEDRDINLKAAIKEEKNNKNVEIIDNKINNNKIINQDKVDGKINDINVNKLSENKKQNNSINNKNDNIVKNAINSKNITKDDVKEKNNSKDNSKLKITNVSKENVEGVRPVNINVNLKREHIIEHTIG